MDSVVEVFVVLFCFICFVRIMNLFENLIKATDYSRKMSVFSEILKLFNNRGDDTLRFLPTVSEGSEMLGRKELSVF